MTNKSILPILPIAISVFRIGIRTLKLVVLICMFTSPLPAGKVRTVTVQDARGVREQCSLKYFGQGEVRECLEKKAQESEVALKRAEGRALSAIAKWDEGDRYIGITRAKLKTSGEAFVRYRNAHCAYIDSLGGGTIGNAIEMIRLSCVFELNSILAKQLSSSVVDLPKK